MHISAIIVYIQLLDQSAVLNNLVQEACQRPHYQVEMKKLSALQNSEVSTFGSILKYCINRT